jgi:NAD/NADP transhydrogenase alpha subunit
MSMHASQLYSKNIYNFFEHIYSNENSSLNSEEEITKGAMLFEKGMVKNEIINKFLNKEDTV